MAVNKLPKKLTAPGLAKYFAQEPAKIIGYGRPPHYSESEGEYATTAEQEKHRLTKKGEPMPIYFYDGPGTFDEGFDLTKADDAGISMSLDDLDFYFDDPYFSHYTH